MATISQQTGKRRVNFMRKINEGNKVIQAMSFSKRKPTLKKKVEELKTLCAVTICMVCFGPDGTVETYPENAEEVKKEIMFYKGLHAMQKREFNLLGYLEHGKRKFELKKQKLKRKKLEALTESLSNQIEGLCGDPLLFFTETLEKKLVGLREKISLLSIRDDKGKAIADDNDVNDHANIFGESLLPYTPEPIDEWPAMDANNNTVRVENNNTLSSNCALSLVHEDLPMSFWDSDLLNLAEIEFQPCTPQQ